MSGGSTVLHSSVTDLIKAKNKKKGKLQATQKTNELYFAAHAL